MLEKIKQYPKQKQQNRIPEYEVSAGTGLAELVKKELADHFTSRRLIIILVLIYATSFASLYGALSGLALGFDAINSERSAGTLNRLVASPFTGIPLLSENFWQDLP